MPRNNRIGVRLFAAILTLGLTLLAVGIHASDFAKDHGVLVADLREHTRFLSSDMLMGRNVGSLELALARDYIAEKLRTYGLSPGGDAGSYFQSLQVLHDVKINEANRLALLEGQPYRTREEWVPMGFSHSGKIEAEVVFAGYGISKKDKSYDDYLGIDAKNRIVMVLRHEPPENGTGGSTSGSLVRTRYSSLRYKARNALKHGAMAMLLVNLHPLQEGEKDLISPTRTLHRKEIGLLAAQIKPEIAVSWLQNHGLSLQGLKEQIDREHRPASVSLPELKVSLTVDLEKVWERSDNIVGFIPGSDPTLKDEYILVGAHYDHIGFGHFGTRNPGTEGQLHNGADDNASGVAVLLSLAKELSQSPERPLRSVVFVAFSGEERGIYGSRHYVRHPPFPLPSTQAMINLDMVGRMRNQRVIVSGLHTDQRFPAILNELGEKNDVTIKSSDRLGRSDHKPFHDHQVPVLHFFTGVHDDYHRPTDVWEKLNFQGMAKVHNLVLGVIRRLAEVQEPLSRSPVREAKF